MKKSTTEVHKRCLRGLAEKVLVNLNEVEEAGDQDLFTRLDRTRRWRGAVVHIVRSLVQEVRSVQR